jgi:hypothetical protein
MEEEYMSTDHEMDVMERIIINADDDIHGAGPLFSDSE